jgi:ferric-dicitrate binding protein FerR (iron transport regulator)
MNCREARELLSAEQDDALEAAERAALAEHLVSCAACPAHRRDLRALVGALRAAPRERAPADARARLEAAFRPRTRRALGMGALAAACLLVLAWWIARPRGPRAVEAIGQVVLARAGAPVPLTRGQLLREKDIVRTQEGRALLRLDGDAELTLEERTTVRLGARPFAVWLERGRARFEVEPGHGDFRVRTPAGEVAVTGTAFEVEVVPINKEADVVKRLTLGFVGASAVGAIVLVYVTRGSVEVRGEGDPITLTAGQSAELVSGQRAEPVPSTSGGRLADRLEKQNAALRAEVSQLRAEVARKEAKAAALPAPGAVETTRDLRAPLTNDERKLLGAANQRVSAEIRAKLAALYQEKNGRPPPAETDEMALATELVKDFQYDHIGVLQKLPRGAGEAEMLKAGLPREGVRVMQLMHERNVRMNEELSKTLPPERAAAVAGTVRATTSVGSSDGGKTVDSKVELNVPPAAGEPLPEPEKKDQK